MCTSQSPLVFSEGFDRFAIGRAEHGEHKEWARAAAARRRVASDFAARALFVDGIRLVAAVVQRDSVATSVSSSRVGHLQVVYIQVQVQVQVQARGSRARTARRRFQWSYSPASTMSSTAPSWSVNALAPAPKRFRTYASLGARRGFRRCFFESGPAAPLGPCARSSGRVLNLLDAFPPAAPPASPCAARLRGGGGGARAPAATRPAAGASPA